MATSWAEETDAKNNYSKLCRLLYDGGTLAVKTVFDGKVPPPSLAATLATNQHKLLKLKKPKGRVLSQDQWDLLYPPSGACPKSDDFDITLLFVLLRNICGLTQPHKGWDALPPSTDTSLQANLARIKYHRNKVTAHSSKAEVDEALFETYWSDIAGSLVSLGLKQDDIDELKSSPLGAKDYNELVECWYLSDEDVKHQLKAMKSKLEEIESKMPNTSENELCKLQYVDYTSLIQKKCKLYHPSTRQWIFDQVEENVKMSTTESSVVLIRAGPGMGKSIIAAKICEIYKNSGLLGGCHFFQHSNSLRNNPRSMLQSIAKQLCSSVDGYQTALETKLKTLQGKIINDLNCEELFGVLFEEPLGQIHTDHNVVIVIDAVDECASHFKQEFEDALKRKTSVLPSWVRFIITTRPLPSCKDLHPSTQIDIDPSDPRNDLDLAVFYADKLTERNVQHLADQLKEITKGIFLVAYFVLDMLDQDGKSLTEKGTFPVRGLSSVYEYYFTRIRNLIKPYIDDGGFFKMLEAVVASERPIPKDMFYEILGHKGSDKVSRDQRKERNDAVHMLHTIFPVENDHVTVFHKSVTDWLTLDDNENPQFSVSVDRGVEVLAEKCLDYLKAFQERPKPLDQPLVLSDRETFAILGIDYVVRRSSGISQTEKNAILGDITVFAAVLGVIRSREEEMFSLPINLFFDYHSVVALHITLRLLFRSEKLRFGHYLSVVGDLMLHHKYSHLSPSDKEKIQHWLVENKVPHYTRQVLSHLPFIDQLFEVANGFIAVSRDYSINNISVLNIDNNYSIGKQKTLQCSPVGVIGVSPDKKYLILTAYRDRNKLELYDVTTLKKKKQYNCPTHDHNGYHIFGNDKEWYILFITKHGAEIQILNGQNGKLHSSLKLDRNEAIRAASQSGHILIENILREDNKDGLTFYTIHAMKPDEKAYYRTANDSVSDWLILSIENAFRKYLFKFSPDGKYVAICTGYNSVFVFRTNDGSLFRKYDHDYIALNIHVMLFLSSSCLVIQHYVRNDTRYLFFYDLTLDRLLYIAITKHDDTFHILNNSPLFVQPPCATDKFIPAIYGLTKDKELVKLEFHNLEQNYYNSP